MEKSTLDDAMEKVRQFPSTANFQDLIQKLQERLSDDSPKSEGLAKEPFHTHPSSGILDPKQHQEHQSHPPTHHEQDSGGGGAAAASNIGKSLNSDTIILFGIPNCHDSTRSLISPSDNLFCQITKSSKTIPQGTQTTG